MEDKEQIKISLKTGVLIILFILVVIFGLLFFIYYIQTTPTSNTTSTTGLTSTTTIYSDTKKDIPTNSNTEFTTYYASVHSDYSFDDQLDNIFVTSPTELKQYLYKCIGTNVVYIENEKKETLISQYFDDDFFEDNNLAIEMYDASSSHHSYFIASVIKNGVNGTINIIDNYHTYGGVFPSSSTLVFIALDKEIQNVKFDIYRTTTNNSDFGMMFIAGVVISIAVIIVVSLIISKHNRKIDNMSHLENKPKKHSKVKKIVIGIIIAILILVVIFFAIVFYEATMMPNMTVYKPIIYLYPTDDIKLSVKLGYEDKITCSYPQYTTSWNVLAKTSSDLIDLNTNRSLYALYYESEAVYNFEIQKDGFIVKGSDITKFLEEKLELLGLTERETEEFIVYWLPILQENEYNYIRFATTEEINQNMPLEFSVQPDTLIRVLMTYKGLDKPIDVEEQQLETPERTGFVTVEWGGTEIK